jgi:hypothetical protein
VHDTDELVMVVDGDVEFEIDDKVHRPGPGAEAVILHAPGTRSGTSGAASRAGCTAIVADEDLRALAGEHFVALAGHCVAFQTRRPPVEQEPRSSRGGRGFDFLASVRGHARADRSRP